MHRRQSAHLCDLQQHPADTADINRIVPFRSGESGHKVLCSPSTNGKPCPGDKGPPALEILRDLLCSSSEHYLKYRRLHTRNREATKLVAIAVNDQQTTSFAAIRDLM